MKIDYRVGDALLTDASFIIQGCNAQGVMGSGIAKLIRDVYPIVFTEYRDHYERYSLLMGEVVPVVVSSVNYRSVWVGDRYILNGITQEFFGRDPNVVYVDYAAISSVIRGVSNFMLRDVIQEFAHIHGTFTGQLPDVALPLIGAGLANGHWPEIARRIEAESERFQPIVYVETQEKLDEIMALVAAEQS